MRTSPFSIVTPGTSTFATRARSSARGRGSAVGKFALEVDPSQARRASRSTSHRARLHHAKETTRSFAEIRGSGTPLMPRPVIAKRLPPGGPSLGRPGRWI